MICSKIGNVRANVSLRSVRATNLQWKAISITYFKCVFVASGIQHGKRMRHLFICGLAESTIFFPHCLINGRIFGKKMVTERKIRVLIFSTTFVWSTYYSEKNLARYDQKCILVFTQSTSYSRQILIKFEFSQQILGKYSNLKLRENPPIGIWIISRGRTDGQTWRS
jgi:hypothetical protein